MTTNTPVENLLSRLSQVSKSGKGWIAQCPAHDDNRASLSIGIGKNGGALVNCFAGCQPETICRAVELTLADLMPASGEPKTNRKRRIAATYDYRDEGGKLLFQVVRYDPKDFRQRRPNGKGGWSWSVKGVRAILYRLNELAKRPNKPVFLVEGEKDADALARWNALATCNAGGAGKWKDEDSQCLVGRKVLILPDNDQPGRDHASKIAASLYGVAESIRIVELPGLPAKGDVSDWIAAGGTQDELKRLVEAAPFWTPESAANQTWPEIDSLDAFDLPEFPTAALPDALRRWVEAESHATQTPPDLAALLALAVCSATIARRIEVEPRRGWREPVNLFVAVLLTPGNRKSAVFADAMKPLRELEAEFIEAARPLVAREQSDRRQDETRLRKLEKTAAEKGDVEARHEACKLAAELAEHTEPVLPRLIVDDVTSEKLEMMLADQGGRIASMSPEGGVFDLMAGLYSKSGMPQFGAYLMGHSGDDLITDRVSRRSVCVQRPALTCAYAMQPQVIEGLAEHAAFRGRGLLARFLYAAPRSWIGRRLIGTEPVSDATRELYGETVRRLAEIAAEVTLNLTSDAATELKEWETEIESFLGDGGDLETIRDWGSKLAGATLRLAAVIHCIASGPDSPINQPAIAAAVEIGRYLMPHAEAVLNMMQAQEPNSEDDARYILRWIVRDKLSEFTKRDAHRHGQRRFRKADDLMPALDELTRRGYIRLRPVQVNGPGRAASPIYEVNPLVSKSEPQKSVDRIDAIQNKTESMASSVNSVNAGMLLENRNRVQVTI